ncbi:MAG TPA: nucleotidyltransferase domain-containing protein [Polyangiaceae bacterium]|nr:nucleotidyltransferase domain-containing protein [Polyangiaceae bacterium]
MKDLDSTPLRELPPELKRQLLAFTEQLENKLGASLVALFVFGGAARGEYHVGSSDIDCAIVLDSATPELLIGLGNLLQLGRFQSRFESIILTLEEVQHAADAFPIFYSDMRRCHVLLTGRDVLSDLQISDHHLRLRVEQELRDCQIHLRRAITDSMGESHALAGAVIRKVKQIRAPLRALAQLEGRSVADKMGEVLADAGRRFQLDVSPLSEPDRAPVVSVGTLMELLSRSIEVVDRMSGEA